MPSQHTHSTVPQSSHPDGFRTSTKPCYFRHHRNILRTVPAILSPNCVAAMQRRLHPRVRLQLPARLRWSAPLSQQTEQCETVNVSRGGLLVACLQAHPPGHPLWVAFPFDAVGSGAQPESIARVLRCEKNGRASSFSWNVAIHFDGIGVRRPRSNLQHDSRQPNGNGSRNSIALPIRVRPVHVPWHEETMTTEVSPDKLRFQTNREYEFGARLMVSFAAATDSPWNGDSEWETEVTGIEMEAGSESLQVTVRRTPPGRA